MPLFFILHSSRPGLRPRSLDRNLKMKIETKNIATVSEILQSMIEDAEFVETLTI